MDDFAKVKAAVDIAAVVGRHVALKPAGSRLVGLCPFHAEKTPSFGVVTEGQYFKCFGCGKGGDVFVFLQEVSKIGPMEALEQLAEEAGIELSRSGQQNAGKKARLLQVAESVQRVFREGLAAKPGATAADLLRRRGIEKETETRFGLGYAPEGRGFLVSKLTQKGVAGEDLEAIGLVRRRENRRYDLFRDRLMIPIRDERGRTIAFGGRRLRDDGDKGKEPKYINSPETTLFHKSYVLYGLDLARQSILETSTVVLVEGYMDVIFAHQAGVANCVAALGTAITQEHARNLARICSKVVLFLDGDEAGVRAAQRAVPILLSQSLEVIVLTLPNGEDPGDFFSAGRGRKEFEEVLESRSFSALDFLLEESGVRHSGDFTARSRATKGLCSIIEQIEDDVIRSFAMQKVAQELDVPLSALLASSQKNGKRGSLNRISREKRENQQQTGNQVPGFDPSLAPPRSAQLIASEELLIALLEQPELRTVAEEVVSLDSISSLAHRKLFQELVADDAVSSHDLLDRMAGDVGAQRVLVDLLERPHVVDSGRLFDGAIQFFEREKQQQIGRELKKRYTDASGRGDANRTLQFLKEYQDWLKGQNSTT